jgi:hypothetical protein
MARKLEAGVREDRALAYVIGACALIFVAQWPLFSREAFLAPEIWLQERMAGALLGWLMMAPLFFYGVAAAVHLLARVFGGRGTWFTARLALFWTLLALAPLMLLQGLTAGFVGPGPALTAVGVVVAMAFFWIWINCMIVAERSGVSDV